MGTSFQKNLTRLRIIIVLLQSGSILACLGWYGHKKFVMLISQTVEDKLKFATIFILCPCTLLLLTLPHHSKVRVYFIGPFILASLVLHIKYLAQGGFGDACKLTWVACDADRVNLALGSAVAVLMAIEGFVSYFGADEYGQPRQGRRQVQQTQSLPSLPSPPQQPQQQPEQQYQLQEQDRKSMLSFASTLQGEEATSDKRRDKRQSTPNIDTLVDDLELGLNPTQLNVPNPTGSNPGSQPS